MDFKRLALRKREELPNKLFSLSKKELEKIDDSITLLASSLVRERNRTGFPPQPLTSHGIMIEQFLDEINKDYDELAQLESNEMLSLFLMNYLIKMLSLRMTTQ